MRRVKYIVFIAILSISFSGCKKYPEDDAFIHLRKVVKRIEGGYIIESYKVDGMDCTYLVPKVSNFNLSYSYYIEFNASQVHYKIRGDRSGGWELTGNKRSLIIYSDNLPGDTIFNPFHPHRTWQIRRLDYDYFWIESSVTGKTCELKFKKVIYENR